jgi:hypothetical protein
MTIKGAIAIAHRLTDARIECPRKVQICDLRLATFFAENEVADSPTKGRSQVAGRRSQI